MKKQLEPNVEQNLNDLKNQLNNIALDENEKLKTDLINTINEINAKEEKLNLLIDRQNEIQELETQLRHVKKKSEAYDIKEYEQNVKVKYSNLNSTKLKKKIQQLSVILDNFDENGKINFWNQLISIFCLRKKGVTLKDEGISLHLLLEDCYLSKLISEKREALDSENFEDLKNDIHKLYVEQYIPISEKILNQTIKENISIDLMNCIFHSIDSGKVCKSTSENPTPILRLVKNNLLELYPIVLTTVDSVISNYYSYFKDNKKVDYIIIDESSQSDILSALPLLYLAKNIIIVGDEKQLSAITDIDKSKMKNTVAKEYDYTEENFLSTISKTISPPSQMLLEHYRCDYNIINYCNKFFYDNKLKIYTEAKKGAMSLIDVNKGHYVIDNPGYLNLREIKCIDEYINHDIKGKFIITPFRLQSDNLKKKYGEAQCGTIHTFQGKGEKQVYFSSVLNETKKSIDHLNSTNNLFKTSLINVAVSRAKEKFVLVSDISFFKKYNDNMKNLIEYIEIYGDKIPDKTVCIFDYLYKQIPTYVPTLENIDNPYEEKIYRLLTSYLKKHNNQYHVVCKLPLAEFVTDKNYLDTHEDLKKFVLSNSHLDFALYSTTINKPFLAIEVDGKHHYCDEKQKTRDMKKEQILKYMEIPLLRIPSKVAWDADEFEEKINVALL